MDVADDIDSSLQYKSSSDISFFLSFMFKRSFHYELLKKSALWSIKNTLENLKKKFFLNIFKRLKSMSLTKYFDLFIFINAYIRYGIYLFCIDLHLGTSQIYSTMCYISLSTATTEKLCTMENSLFYNCTEPTY